MTGGLAVHCAYNVAFVVNGYDEEFAYAVPEPFAAVFHPANVKPVRVNAFAVKLVADDAVCDDIDPEPPFASNVTVDELAVHCAYNVRFDAGEKLEPAGTSTPEPFAAVFHPVNV